MRRTEDDVAAIVDQLRLAACGGARADEESSVAVAIEDLDVPSDCRDAC